MSDPNRLAAFDEHRGLLFSIAYRMLGSVADAVGRWGLVDRSSLAISPIALVVLLAVLLPAAIINVIVLLRRPATL